MINKFMATYSCHAQHLPYQIFFQRQRQEQKMYSALNTCPFFAIAPFTLISFALSLIFLPFVPCFCNLHLTSFQLQSFMTFEYATTAISHHYQNVWCIKYLSIINYSCLYVCNSPMPFILSLIFLHFVPYFSNLHLPFHSNNQYLSPLNMQLQQ